jgi:hypothetical protein
MMRPGTLVKYREKLFFGDPLLGIILGEEYLGPTDYTFYRILLEDGKITVIADTRLTPV